MMASFVVNASPLTRKTKYKNSQNTTQKNKVNENKEERNKQI